MRNHVAVAIDRDARARAGRRLGCASPRGRRNRLSHGPIRQGSIARPNLLNDDPPLRINEKRTTNKTGRPLQIAAGSPIHPTLPRGRSVDARVSQCLPALSAPLLEERAHITGSGGSTITVTAAGIVAHLNRLVDRSTHGNDIGEQHDQNHRPRQAVEQWSQVTVGSGRVHQYGDSRVGIWENARKTRQQHRCRRPRAPVRARSSLGPSGGPVRPA